MTQNRENIAEWTLLNLLRGVVASSEYLAAAILLDEVKKQVSKTEVEKKPEMAYAVLLRAADSSGIQNPFRGPDIFEQVLLSSYSVDNIEWESIISTSFSSRENKLPAPIVELYEERLMATMPETVLIAEAEKFAPNLSRLVKKYGEVQFVLSSQQTIYIFALNKIFADMGNVEVVEASIYDYEFLNRRFDLIFAAPTVGGRMLTEEGNFICREFDLVALENLSLHLNASGHLTIMLPARITFALGKVSDLRQFIQTNYTLRELSELPEGSLEHTAVRMILLDVERERPSDEDVIVKRYSSGKRKNRREPITSLSVSDETFVMLSELEEQGNWSIGNIFAQQDKGYISFQNSDVKKDVLGNVARVFRGKALNKNNMVPSGSIGIVGISNIGEYAVDYSGLDHYEEEENKVTKYLLQDGDLLLPARGTAVRTAVFHKQPFPCIASSNVIVIRPDRKALNGTYLKVFLDSPIGGAMIRGTQQGTVIMNISYKDLSDIEIPLPEIEKQNDIADKYEKGLSAYLSTLETAETQWRETVEELQKF